MGRLLFVILAAGLLLLCVASAQAAPGGIRYDARTHTYTNVGSARSAPSTPSTPAARKTRDADFVEYTLAPSKTVPTSRMTAAGYAPPPASSPASNSAPPPATTVVGSSYPVFEPYYGGGYQGGYGGYYGGYGGYFGYPGYLPYSGYAYGHGTRRVYPAGFAAPVTTNVWIPGQGIVPNTILPGFGFPGSFPCRTFSHRRR